LAALEENVCCSCDDVGTAPVAQERDEVEQMPEEDAGCFRSAADMAPAAPDGDHPGTGTDNSWHVAGGTKEKDMLPWWRERLAALELGTKATNLIVESEQIKSVTGKAVVVNAHGALNYFFDLRFQFDFRIERLEKTASGLPMQTSSSGLVRVSDFSHERRGGCSVEIDGADIATNVADAELLPKLRAALLECIADYESQV